VSKGLLEAVPNLSEGRDGARLGRMLSSIAARDRVQLLDASADADHNRAVLTLAGEQDELTEALFQLIEVALKTLNLGGHRGVHPRFGVVDVVPFVPLSGASFDDAVGAAQTLARRVGRRLELPVVLYGKAARSPDRAALPAARRTLRRALAAGDLAAIIDEGPPRAHPTAGVAMIGARSPLIAFNVVLKSKDVERARVIAARVRESAGGLPAVRALGVELASRNAVQVTMNLTDPTRTTPAVAFKAVKRQATELGVDVESAEIVGLMPEAAAADLEALDVPLEGRLEDRLLEPRLRRLGLLQ
jgi:glutamate formiminotransferase